MTWGDCPTCHAKHGEYCSPDVGLHLGAMVSGTIPKGSGIHLSRSQRTPSKLKIQGVA